jgi:uncharacterized protein with FMN-binding domain
LAPVKNNLVALGSAAVVAVYAAGYAKTRDAAAQFADESRDLPPIHPAKHDAVVPEVAPARSTASPTPVAKVATDAPTKPVGAKKVAATPTKTDTARQSPKAEQPTVAKVAVAPPAMTPPVAATATPVPPVTPPKDTTTKAVAAPDTAAKSDKNAPLKDGMFVGWGTSRHGDIQATVMVREGKIVGAVISECLTQYSCSWISMLPQQVIDRQSAEVDFVSGATQSTNAFYYAVVNALKKAK